MIFDSVEFCEGAVLTGFRAEGFVHVARGYAVSHQRHLDGRVGPGVDTPFTREFLDVKKVSNGLRIAGGISVKSAFLIEGHVRPEDLWHHAVVRDRYEHVVIH